MARETISTSYPMLTQFHSQRYNHKGSLQTAATDTLYHGWEILKSLRVVAIAVTCLRGVIRYRAGKMTCYRQESHINNLQRSRIRSEEHTSELQSRGHLVCRLLL